MNFKKGDTLICVSISGLDNPSEKELQLYGKYTVSDVLNILTFHILTFKELLCAYDIYRFKTIEQFRKDKIDKVKKRINGHQER